MATSYEAQRAANIAANKAILASLGLEAPASGLGTGRQSTTHSVAKTAANKVQKRKAPRKATATPLGASEDAAASGPTTRRRSARLASATRKSLREKDLELASSDSDDGNANDDFVVDEDSDGGYVKASENGFVKGVKGGRTVLKFDEKQERKNCKYFGAPDVPIGTCWAQRAMVSRDGVHGPWVAGIYGDPKEGAYSVALSGGYEDDVDEGFRFTFTGEGGRDLKGTKKNPKNLRTGPQCKDQPLSRGNAALWASVENKKPVRVIRGFKAAGKWAPKSGYRYDGLYRVCKAWQDTGASGFKVYKFAFKRIDGQPPIQAEEAATGTVQVASRL